MKYKAVIDTDDYKDFEFFEDGSGRYMVGEDAGAASSGGWIPLYFTECTQESVLDKIRAEIDLETRVQVKHYTNTDDIIDAILDTIDKYKSEEGYGR